MPLTLHQLLNAGSADLLNVSIESFQERLALRCADAVNALQAADYAALGALLPIGCDGEAMRLIADALH